MTDTLNRAYPYPRPIGDGADVSYWLQRLAEALDTDVTTIVSSITANKAAADKQARGLVKEQDNPATSTGLAGAGVLINLVTVTLTKGRSYRLKFRMNVRSSMVAMQIVTKIVKSATSDGTSAGTDLASVILYSPPVANSWGVTPSFEVVYTPANNETINIKATAARATGTVTYDVSGRLLSVTDEGVA